MWSLLLNKNVDLAIAGAIAVFVLTATIYHKGERACDAQQASRTADLVTSIQEKKNEINAHSPSVDALIKRLQRGTF